MMVGGLFWVLMRRPVDSFRVIRESVYTGTNSCANRGPFTLMMITMDNVYISLNDYVGTMATRTAAAQEWKKHGRKS